jgi:hypothetical protein
VFRTLRKCLSGQNGGFACCETASRIFVPVSRMAKSVQKTKCRFRGLRKGRPKQNTVFAHGETIPVGYIRLLQDFPACEKRNMYLDARPDK